MEKPQEYQVKVARDAKTGRFIRREVADKRPSTTIVQKVLKRRTLRYVEPKEGQ